MNDESDTHLGAHEQVNIPLPVPRRPLGRLRAAENSHEMGCAETDETPLPATCGVRPVCAIANGSFG